MTYFKNKILFCNFFKPQKSFYLFFLLLVVVNQPSFRWIWFLFIFTAILIHSEILLKIQGTKKVNATKTVETCCKNRRKFNSKPSFMLLLFLNPNRWDLNPIQTQISKIWHRSTWSPKPTIFMQRWMWTDKNKFCKIRTRTEAMF